MTGLLTSAISPSALSLRTLNELSAGTFQETNDPMSSAFERAKGNTGIVSSHLMPLQQIAAQTNSIIGVRPVESVATGLIEAGHPTKDLHIKGKSANWGPQAGLISTDQAFSKLEKLKQAAPDIVARANEQIQECIRDGHAVPVPLKISRNRLDTLIKHGHITHMATTGHEGNLRFSAKGPSQQSYEFEGRRTSPSEDNYLITHLGKPVEVLAKSTEGKALTADYDLHMIAPHISDFGPQDNLSISDVAHSVFTDRMDGYRHHHAETPDYQVPRELRADYDNPSHFYQKADAHLGNATKRTEVMIELINKTLVGNGERVVHHGADSGNPVTDVTTNYPATFFLPTKLGRFDEICIINDGKEMAELIKTAKDGGYHVPLNPLWEREVVSIRRASFTQAQERRRQPFANG